MMYGKKMMAPAKPAGKKAAAFKPCKGCPSPAKCAKAGVCAMKAKAK
jgi:hypothetical protein